MTAPYTGLALAAERHGGTGRRACGAGDDPCAAAPAGVAGAHSCRRSQRAFASQVAWLTMPLLRARAPRAPTAACPCDRRDVLALRCVAGVLVWFIPLAWLSGGLSTYWQVLSTQGAEDLSGVVTLWTTPTPRQLLSGLGSACRAVGTPALAAVVPLLAVAVSRALSGPRRRRRSRRLPSRLAPHSRFICCFRRR